uniref:EF-hand domain-containing protein n=1 Tax=Lotharella oceanica TaxID=641309 RepID=A0A7S2TMM9_9EUKA
MEGFPRLVASGAALAAAAAAVGYIIPSESKGGRSPLATAAAAASAAIWWLMNREYLKKLATGMDDEGEGPEKAERFESLESLEFVETNDYFEDGEQKEEGSTLSWFMEKHLRMEYKASLPRVIKMFGPAEKISLKEFLERFRIMISMGSAPPPNKDMVSNIGRRIFKAFDRNNDGVVSKREFVIGMSVLFGYNKRESNIESAFEMFDKDGDKEISLEEMTLYFQSHFEVAYALDPTFVTRFNASGGGTRGRLPTTREIAESTAKLCFSHADKNKDGTVCFEEFKAWFFEKEDGKKKCQHRRSSCFSTVSAQGSLLSLI